MTHAHESGIPAQYQVLGVSEEQYYLKPHFNKAKAEGDGYLRGSI